MKPTFHAFKKSASGEVFVQWKKGEKFCLVDAEIATYILWVAMQ